MSRGKYLTQADNKEMERLYNSGMPPKKIADIFGLASGSIVNRKLKRMGVKANQVIPVSQEELDYMIKEYTAGISSEVIAEELGRSGTVVIDNLKKNNIPIRPTSRNKKTI
jgi:IS30 family transposase